jgi:hypothetical protein
MGSIVKLHPYRHAGTLDAAKYSIVYYVDRVLSKRFAINPDYNTRNHHVSAHQFRSSELHR